MDRRTDGQTNEQTIGELFRRRPIPSDQPTDENSSSFRPRSPSIKSSFARLCSGYPESFERASLRQMSRASCLAGSARGKPLLCLSRGGLFGVGIADFRATLIPFRCSSLRARGAAAAADLAPIRARPHLSRSRIDGRGRLRGTCAYNRRKSRR